MFHPTTERIGIIGAGTITGQFYIPALRNLGYTRITLNDLHEQSASLLADQYELQTASLPKLIEESAVIIIATPPHSHFKLLQQCVTAGNKTVICEKPFLFSKQETLEVMQYATQYSSRVLVAHLRRIFTAIDHAQKLIPTLQLGNFKKASLWEGGRFTYKPKSDYTTENIYGGVLLDTGSHVIDCLLHVTGLTKTDLNCKVQHIKRDKPEPAHEVSSSFKLNDIAVDLHLSRYTALANKMTLHYENGIVEIPLGLKPNIVVTRNGKRTVYSNEQACLSYMGEAFKVELQYMLTRPEDVLFEVSDFVNLCSILETLYHA